MENNKIFCPECREDVSYKVKNIKLEASIKGEIYNYTGKVCYCDFCGSELYLDSVNDYNLKSLYDVYREENNIISLEEIADILKKYNIGKRPLSQLLGWGELTLTRYLDGDIPSKEYSDKLKNIHDNPDYFLKILEENKDVLKTVAYDKAKKAVEDFKSNLNNKSKINVVANYFIYRCGDITNLALQKLLYYAQGFYFAFNNKFLFVEDCEAWVHGPVYREIYKKFKENKFNPIEPLYLFDEFSFSDSEKLVLDNVVKNLGCYSGKILENFTHLESPWIDARGSLKPEDYSDEIIDKDDIANYFSDIKASYHMHLESDISLYSEEMFNITRNY